MELLHWATAVAAADGLHSCKEVHEGLIGACSSIRQPWPALPDLLKAALPEPPIERVRKHQVMSHFVPSFHSLIVFLVASYPKMAGVKPPETALRGTLSKMRYALMSQNITTLYTVSQLVQHAVRTENTACISPVQNTVQWSQFHALVRMHEIVGSCCSAAFMLAPYRHCICYVSHRSTWCNRYRLLP